MTEKDEQSKKNSIDNPEILDDESSEPSIIDTQDLDIQGALAAVASLNDLTREEALEAEMEQSVDDALEIQEFERVEVVEEDFIERDIIVSSEYDDIDEEANIEHDNFTTDYTSSLPRPPLSVLHRGQLASVIPAIILIALGAYLTFLTTTTDIVLQTSTVVIGVLISLGVVLLAQWMSSARWSTGSFFIGTLLILVIGTMAYLVLPNNLTLLDGYPLLLTAIGTAFVITDIFSPSERRIWLFGLILAIIGIAGVLITSSMFDANIVAILSNLLPLAVIIIIILLIAPFLRRQ